MLFLHMRAIAQVRVRNKMTLRATRRKKRNNDFDVLMLFVNFVC